MKHENRSNALLIELLIVIIFFMFVSVTLVELFQASRQKSITARSVSSAILDAQNIAEELYGASDPDGCLLEIGFVREGESWTLSRDGYILRITDHSEEYAGGILHTRTVTAEENQQTLVSLPSVRYEQKEAAP